MQQSLTLFAGHNIEPNCCGGYIKIKTNKKQKNNNNKKTEL